MKMFIILEPHGIFDQALHAYSCQHSLTTGMQNHIFGGRGFAEHQSRLFWPVSENAHNS